MPPYRIHLEKCQPQRNRFRFYRLSLEPNLFGGWSLVREWGRIGRAGCMHADLYATLEAAQLALDIKLQEKGRKGYHGRHA
jgi:predicted DNA-binding WGR domain protein